MTDSIISVMFCAIWYHLHNFKNVRNSHGGVQAKMHSSMECFSQFFKLGKWYQIAQRITIVYGDNDTKRTFRTSMSTLDIVIHIVYLPTPFSSVQTYKF